jgi:hypothetical protein
MKHLKLKDLNFKSNKLAKVGKVTLTLIGSDFELRSTSPLRIAKAIDSGNVFNKYDLKTLTEPGKNGSSRHLVPMVKFSGYTDNDGRFHNSGLMAIHIINPSDPYKVRDTFGSWPEVYMAYVLDTGNVVVIFKERGYSKINYEDKVQDIIDELYDLFGLKVDQRCTNRDFLAPISYDSDIKVNIN